MNTPDVLYLALGGALGFVVLPLLALVFRAVTLNVDDEEALLVTTLGKLTRTIKEPGLVLLPSRVLPWVETRRVSLRKDYRRYAAVHVNDARGTTVIVDLWVELRITDPAKAIFSVADWDRSLQNLVAHAATSILGSRDFQEILCDRTELGTLLQKDIAHETERWGVSIEYVFIRNVSLLPEVSRQMFETIAARLEREKAHVQEEGRLRVALLEADTSARVASLVAEAKGQYPLAIGRGLAELKTQPQIFAAYNQLYDLSLLRPHRTVTFRGFAAGELDAAEAAMVTPGDTPPATMPLLPSRPDGVVRAR